MPKDKTFERLGGSKLVESVIVHRTPKEKRDDIGVNGTLKKIDGMYYVDIPDTPYLFPANPKATTLDFMARYKTALGTFLKPIRNGLRHIIPPYSEMHPPVRAVYDAVDKLKSGEVGLSGEVKVTMVERWEILRDLLCMLMEYDTAYRWRFQLLVELLAGDDRIRLTDADMFFFDSTRDFKMTNVLGE